MGSSRIGSRHRFVGYYNTARPYRALGRRTPREVFDAKLKTRLATSAPDTHFRARRDRVGKVGHVTLRYEGRLLHIGVGRAWAGRRVILLVANRDVRVLSEDGTLLRQLTLDPTRIYQRLNPT